ncbi:MAG: LysR family transcriptional regulator [Gammaproteobacteria bacterium]|nr:LysR family transcriptional regulator [Gammaproteobacteria bacterium]
MDTRELLKIDLNLLISLQVLLEERNVSRAAERLFITQPAMSKTLSRLRGVFDDPLFTRSSHGMQPTPRALQLAQQLETVLQDIQQLVTARSFNPDTYRGEITIALSEYIGIGVLPQLMARLQFMAPGLTLRSITRVERQLDQLAAGSLDFAIHIRHRGYTDDFIYHSLGSNPPVILVREAHPLSGQAMTWEEISQYPIIRLYISDLEELEIFHSEANFGRLRNDHSAGSFETSHLLTALEVLRNTDFLMPGPPFVLRNPTVGYKIQALPFPEEVSYQVEYMLVRHRRTEKSPVHNWLWEQILEVITDLSKRMS